MAKIDVTQIEGFEGMTDAEKVAALTGLDLPEPDHTGYVEKEKLDKATSEAAEWKRKYNARMTDEEKNQQANEDMKNRLAQLEKEKTIADYKANFLAQGYPEKLAEECANALADGDTKTLFEAQQRFLKEFQAGLDKKHLEDTPRPDGGDGDDKKTDAEKFAERMIAQRNASHGKADELRKKFLGV